MALSKIRSDSLEDTAIHGNRNLIINGAMQVAQRGGSATTSNRTVDRFLNTYGDATITQSQDTAVPANKGFSNSYKHEVTSASSASGGFFGVLYKIEAQDIRNSGWDYTSASSSITLSFFAKASVAGTYMCGLQTHDGTGQVINTQYTLAANTWKKITATFPGNSNVTIDNNNGNGLTVYLLKEFGGAYTSGSTFDAWAAYSSSAQSPDANINLFDTANATFFVTGVQLEVGEQETPFEHRSFGNELIRCQRYTYVFNSQKINGEKSLCNLSKWSNGYAYGSFSYPIEMRTAPSATIYNKTEFSVYIAGSVGQVSGSDTFGIGNQTTDIGEVYIECGEGSTGQSGFMRKTGSASGTSSGYIVLDAEL